MAVLTVRDCRPNMEERSSSPRAWASRLGTRWAADVAERKDTGPRLLCAPREIYLGDGSGETDLTGRTGDHLG